MNETERILTTRFSLPFPPPHPYRLGRDVIKYVEISCVAHWYYRGNLIASYERFTHNLTLRHCNFHTATTRSRFNAILEHFNVPIYVCIRRGVLCNALLPDPIPAIWVLDTERLSEQTRIVALTDLFS